jgi:hypothetical protein
VCPRIGGSRNCGSSRRAHPKSQVIYGTLSKSMSFVELQIPPKVLLEVFAAESVCTGMTQAVPGGATLTVGGLDKRTHSLPLVPVILALGSDDASNLVSGWLYDKLKHANVQHILIEGVEIEVTAQEIAKAISESVHVERHIGPDDEGSEETTVPQTQIDSSKDAIVCLRVPSDFDTAQYVQGSTILKCSVCESAVLVSPSSQTILAAGQHQIVCMECWTEVNPPGMSPEQRESKLRSLRDHKSAGEQAYDDMYEKAHSPSDASMFYSEAKESFHSAIGLARELGLEQEVEEIEKRLAHIKAVFRSQFT